MLTLSQIVQRSTFVGGSDAPAVVGLSPWRSAWDVWAEKIGIVNGDALETPAMIAGSLLEPAILSWGCNRLGTIADYRQELIRNSDHEWMGATLDCRAILASGEPTIIEGKTSGICSPLRREEWGEDGSDDVPVHVAVQVQHQLYCAGREYRRAFVAALLGGRGFVMYELRRNEAAIEALFEREQEFWHKNVMKRIAPDDEPSHDIAKRLRRTTGKQAEVDRDLALAVVTQRKAMKAQKEAVDAAEAALLLALGDAEYGVFDGGTLTYTETHRKAYSVEETTFRQLRIKDNGDKS